MARKLALFLFVLLIFTRICMPNSDGETGKETTLLKNKTDSTYYEIKKKEIIVVTATMTPKTLSNCSSSVSVIEKKQIEA